MPLPLNERIQHNLDRDELARQTSEAQAQLDEDLRTRIQAALERRNYTDKELKGTTTYEALGSDGYVLSAEFLQLMAASGWPGVEHITDQPKNSVHIHKMGGKHSKPKPQQTSFHGYPIGYVGQESGPSLSYILHRSAGANDPEAQWKDEQIRKSSDKGPFSPVYLCTDNVLRVAKPSDEYAGETELHALGMDARTGTYVLPWPGLKINYTKTVKSNLPGKSVINTQTFPGATDLRVAPLETVLDAIVTDLHVQGLLANIPQPINVLPPPTVTP